MQCYSISNLKSVLAVLLSAILLLAAWSVQAQESEERGLIDEGVFVEATIVEKTDEMIVIEGVVDNSTTNNLNDLRYGVQLFDASTELVVDTVVSDDRINLEAGESTALNLSYPIPKHLPVSSTTIQLSLFSRNGEMLGSNNLDSLALSDTADFKIVEDSCAVISEYVSAGQDYYVNPGDVVEVSCNVQNNTSESSFQKNGNTYRGSVWGELTQTQIYDSEITVPARTSNQVVFSFQAPDVSQKYTTQLKLVGDEVESNTINLDYVVVGADATIKSLSFKETPKAVGEELLLELDWQSNTLVSEVEQTVPTTSGLTVEDFPVPEITARLGGNDGNRECLVSGEQVLSIPPEATSLSADLTAECSEYTVIVQLINQDGLVLDTVSRKVSGVNKPVSNEEASVSNYDLMSLIGISLLTVIILLIMIQSYRHFRVKREDDVADIDDN